MDIDNIPSTWAPALTEAHRQADLPSDLLPELDADWLRDWEDDPDQEDFTYPEYIAANHQAAVDDFSTRDLWDGDTLRSIASLADEISRLITIGVEL